MAISSRKTIWCYWHLSWTRSVSSTGAVCSVSSAFRGTWINLFVWQHFDHLHLEGLTVWSCALFLLLARLLHHLFVHPGMIMLVWTANLSSISHPWHKTIEWTSTRTTNLNLTSEQEQIDEVLHQKGGGNGLNRLADQSITICQLQLHDMLFRPTTIMVTRNGTLNYLARERWGPTLLRIVAIIRVITNWMPSTAISLKCLFVFFRVVECQFELSSRKGEYVFCEQRSSRKSFLVQNHTSKPSGREELLLAISPLDLVASG